MTGVLLGQSPVRRAAQRFVLVTSAGALGAAVCATVMLAVGSGAQQAGRGVGTERPPDLRSLSAGEQAAANLLSDAASSAAALQFRGRKLFGSWGPAGASSVLADVDHVPGRGTRLRVTSANSGSTDDPDELPDGLDQPDEAAITALTSHYRVRIADPVPCVGRLAEVVEAAGLASGKVAGRFWIDRETGILLRHEVYDATGRQIRMSAFLDLDVDPAAGPGELRPTSRPRHPGLTDPGELRRSGWLVPEALPGGLALYRSREVRTEHGHAVQLTYLDGLFSASLFAQRGRLEPDDLDGFERRTVGGAQVFIRQGLYRQVVWSGGDTVYTLVTDAPDPLVPEMVTMLPHTAPQGDVLDRMGRGIERVGSWINPFQ